jgi:hypothetical protein
MEMEVSGRLFNCARCLHQHVICSHCDRGNIYCSSECASATRKERQKLSGQRYQDGFRGRQKHAARQARYRTRQKEKVTHQGSPRNCPDDLLLLSPEGQSAVTGTVTEKTIFCSFCRKSLSSALRITFLQRQVSRIWPAFPSGP